MGLKDLKKIVFCLKLIINNIINTMRTLISIKIPSGDKSDSKYILNRTCTN